MINTTHREQYTSLENGIHSRRRNATIMYRNMMADKDRVIWTNQA